MVAVSLKKKIFFKQKTAYEILRSDWSSDVCSSDLAAETAALETGEAAETAPEAAAAKRTVALQTGEAAAKMDCYSEESMALAASLRRN